MNTNKIYDLIKEKKISIEILANEIEMTREGLRRSLISGNIKLSKLEMIAKYFKVSMNYFFDESEATGIGVIQNGHYNNITGKGDITISHGEQACRTELEKVRDKVKSLEEQLKLKDDIIKGNEKMIRLLEGTSKG